MLAQCNVYSYANLGNLTFLDDQADGSDDATLGYDHLHRLTSASGLWGSYGYTYDPLHNLRSRTGPSGLTYSYDASNRLSGITGAQTRSYAYNAKGEITGDGIKSFTLNADGQITSITGVASYAYDGNGRRIKVTPQGGTAEYALYGLGGDLLYTEKGAAQTDYLKLAGQTLVELRKSAGVTAPVYLHPDLLVSPRKATNAAAAILWQEHFDPYGAKLNGVAEKIGYTGHAQDAESGYVYMQARFYDPLVGRFLSVDPVHFQDRSPFTFNRYAYANNNPYKFNDPDGQIANFVIKAVVDFGLEVGVQYLTTGEVDVGSALIETGKGLINPAKTLERARDLKRVVGKARVAKPEPSQLARGKRAHREEPIRPGEKAEVATPSGGRMDRYNDDAAHIREIKPDNPRAIRAGEKQVEGYRQEVEKATGRPHTTEVTPYDPKKYER